MTTPINGIAPGSFPNQATGPSPGEKVTATSVTNMGQGLANQDKFLNDNKVAKAGDTMTGALVINAALTVSGLASLNGGATIPTGQALTAASGSTTKLLGRKGILRPRVVLSDADHTIDVTQGDRFEMPVAPAAQRLITLASTTPVIPSVGETMAIVVNFNGGNSTNRYVLLREDTSTVASLIARGAAATAVYAEVEWDGTKWRLGQSSGTSYDGTIDYGVVPDPTA